MMLTEDCSKYDLKHLKDCVCAGEPLYPEVYNKVLNAMGLRLREGFGQSETVAAIANFPWMECKPGSMGKPSPTYDVDIVDDEGHSLPTGEQGHVIFRLDNGRPAGMFDCYYRAQEVTDQAFRDGLYYTGDIAYRDEDGYYWYVCRADDTIKSSGYKIGPFEVESVLQEHPAVQECAVTGVPDPIRGQIVKATIVLSADFMPSEELVKELQEFVKHTTAPYKYPRLIEFVEALPRTHSGKISRNVIRKTDLAKAGACEG
jgi:acetyl-CoA synthetase